MENLDIDTILERAAIKNKIIDFIDNYNYEMPKKGIIIQGKTAIGKTLFIKNMLKDKYGIIYLNSFDNRNKAKIETLKGKYMCHRSILSSFHKTNKKIIIVLDDINSMSIGDKGGINSLVKLLKVKKNLNIDGLVNPLICINNTYNDKKINELKKKLININLDPPSDQQIEKIIKLAEPNIPLSDLEMIKKNSENSLSKLDTQLKMFKLFNKPIDTIEYKLNKSFYVSSRKALVDKLTYDNYLDEVKDTDKTSISLIFHENIIDILGANDINLYIKILNNICYGDYIDKIIFKYQLWNFNEVSYLIKILINNIILHKNKKDINEAKIDIRFTKVLTKYSTEYSNYMFINYLCQKFNLDMNDLFLYINNLYSSNNDDEYLTTLEKNRIYKFLDLHII